MRGILSLLCQPTTEINPNAYTSEISSSGFRSLASKLFTFRRQNNVIVPKEAVELKTASDKDDHYISQLSLQVMLPNNMFKCGNKYFLMYNVTKFIYDI